MGRTEEKYTDTAADDGTADAVMSEETTNETADELAETAEAAENGTVAAPEPTTTELAPGMVIENVPMGRVGHWNTVIVILGSDVVGERVETDFIIQLLRDKVIQAGKYDVTVLFSNPQNIGETLYADDLADAADTADAGETAGAVNSSEKTVAEEAQQKPLTVSRKTRKMSQEMRTSWTNDRTKSPRQMLSSS